MTLQYPHVSVKASEINRRPIGLFNIFLDSKFHVAPMGPTWVLSAQGGPHVGPMNLAIGVVIYLHKGD